MISEHINYLKTIFNNKELRTQLEELIKSSRSSIQSNIKNKAVSRKDIIENQNVKIKERLRYLADLHNIELKALKMYITLDYRLFNKLDSSIVEHSIKEEAIFKNLRSKKNKPIDIYKLKGSAYYVIYAVNSLDVIYFLEENINLFPDSAQDIIKTLKKEREYKSELEVITNDFESKIYYKTLGDKFDNVKLIIHSKYFGWISNNKDRTKTLYYFYKNIDIKYKTLEDKDLDTLKNNLLKMFRDRLVNANIEPKRRKDQEDLISIINKDRDFAQALMNKIPQKAAKKYFASLITQYDIEFQEGEINE